MLARKPYQRPPRQPLVLPEVKPEPRASMPMSKQQESVPKENLVRSEAVSPAGRVPALPPMPRRGLLKCLPR